MNIRNAMSLSIMALCLAAFLWASSFIVLKIAFQYYDPIWVIFGRLLIASICFAFFWKNFRDLNYQPGDWKPLLFMAFCEPCLYFVLEAMALERTQASQAGMITAMLPLMMAVAAHFLLDEHITRRTMVGFGLAVVGAGLLSLGAVESATAPNPALGNLLEILAMACAMGQMITLKKLCIRYSPWFLTAVQAVIGTLFFLPLTALPSTAPPTGFHLEGLLAIFYLGSFISIGAYGLYNYGMSKIPAHQATAFTNLIPLLTLLMGWAVLDETLTPLQYVASAIVLCGVILSQDRRKRKKSATIGHENS